MSISSCVPAITKRLNNYLATCTNTRYQEQVHHITTNTNDTLNCYEQLWKDPIANSYLKIELIMFLVVVVVDYSFLSFLIYLNIQSKNSIIIVSSLWPFFRWLLSMFVCLSGSWHWWKNAKYGLVTVWTARGLAPFLDHHHAHFDVDYIIACTNYKVLRTKYFTLLKIHVHNSLLSFQKKNITWFWYPQANL